MGKLSNSKIKYNYNRDLFSTIETEELAYFLGWIASDGTIQKNRVQLEIHKKDKHILKDLLLLLNLNIPIFESKKNTVGFTINSVKIVKNICNWLNIVPGKKSFTVNFPYLLSENLKRHFIRGFFDGDGHVTIISKNNTLPRCGITTNSESMRNGITDFLQIPFWTDNKERIVWSGNNALDMLYKLYNNSHIYLNRKANLYQDIATWTPSIGYSRFWKTDFFRWAKSRPDAVIPSKVRASDSGYDLTIIDKIKTNGDTTFYDTGIKVSPAFGYYGLVVPRSSLSKSGYIMTNSVGIIDRTYLGNIIIALTKIDKNMPEIKLPMRVAQLIPQQIQHFEFKVVDDLELTERDTGAFGSTNEKNASEQ